LASVAAAPYAVALLEVFSLTETAATEVITGANVSMPCASRLASEALASALPAASVNVPPTTLNDTLDEANPLVGTTTTV
jgi:hypothetical protein